MHRKAQTLKNEYILHSVQTLRVSETVQQNVKTNKTSFAGQSLCVITRKKNLIK